MTADAPSKLIQRQLSRSTFGTSLKKHCNKLSLTDTKCLMNVFWLWSGLQNDHKAIMVEIEEALHKLHASEKAKRQKDETESQEEAMEPQTALPPPFARVDAVTQGSPAGGAVSAAHTVSHSKSGSTCAHWCSDHYWWRLSRDSRSAMKLLSLALWRQETSRTFRTLHLWYSTAKG